MMASGGLIFAGYAACVLANIYLLARIFRDEEAAALFLVPILSGPVMLAAIAVFAVARAVWLLGIKHGERR